MAKRKKTSTTAQNIGKLDRLMARMIIGMRKDEPVSINPKESALILKILAYALQKMSQDLKVEKESNEDESKDV